MVKQIILIGAIITVGVGLFLVLRRSLPYSNSDELLSATISVDRIWSLGPATAIFDKHSHQYYWLKSYTSFHQSGFDTLKSKQARIRYMSSLKGHWKTEFTKCKLTP